MAGRWRGRRIGAPRGTDTRPTSDRVREAVFGSLASMLGEDLVGATVLDAFAGSGALGLEALSRGASAAVFIERDRSARVALDSNVCALEPVAARIVAGDAFVLAAKGAIPGGPFGLILLDPPYRIDSARVGKLLEDLVAADAVEADAVVVWEHASDVGVSWPDDFDERADRRYGSTSIGIAVYSRMGRHA